MVRVAVEWREDGDGDCEIVRDGDGEDGREIVRVVVGWVSQYLRDNNRGE